MSKRASTAPGGRPVVLLDVDNTLLDNDRVQADLGERIVQEAGVAVREGYWALYEELRSQLGYSDYVGALRRLAERGSITPGQHQSLAAYLLAYPFARRLYPASLEVIDALTRWATPVILSDGDPVFQPRKIRRAGLWDAVEGRVLVYVHKEKMLEEIEEKYPASAYAMVDDKLRILAAMKGERGNRLTTVFVRQGHYAHDPEILAAFPPADISLESVGDLPASDLQARLKQA